MRYRKASLPAALVAVLLAGCGGSGAPPAPVPARLYEDPGFVATGDHEMRYGIVLASELPAEVATTYGINRSKDRAVVNVSVLRRRAEALPTPIEAEVEGEWRTVISEPKPLLFRPILQGGAISYVAEVPVRHQQPTTFELHARPPQAAAMTARITRAFDTEQQ